MIPVCHYLIHMRTGNPALDDAVEMKKDAPSLEHPSSSYEASLCVECFPDGL